MEATGYLVSTDDGVTFTEPSSGSNGTTHTVTGLQIGQSVSIIVRSLGNSACETSSNSTPLTARALNPDINQIFVANAFTPNGDGKNDIVYVHNENIKTLKFYVYDQWGELLFTSMSQQQGWDGTFKGKTEPAGVYVYYLEAMMNNGERVTKKGTITLLR
jgi:gliding motility-associated-like protein